MSMLSSFLGMDAQHEAGAALNDTRGRANKALDQYSDPTFGMDQLREAIKSQVSAAMPQFNAGIQHVRANANKRGLGMSGLETSYEGDAASAFNKHLTAAISGQTYNLFNDNRSNYLDILSGLLDRNQGQKNAADQHQSDVMGGLFKMGAAALF